MCLRLKCKKIKGPLIFLNLKFLYISSKNIEENLYVGFEGVIVRKFAPWTRDFSEAVSYMRAGNN